MQAEPANTAERAYDCLYRLVTEIGPRPAGSPAERQAQDLLAGELAGWNYTLQYQPVPFAPQPRYQPYFLIPALAFLAAAWLLPRLPWLALFLPLLVAGLPELADALTHRLPRTAESRNLMALPPGADLAHLDLLLCAHVDTARAVPTAGELWFQWRSQIFAVMQRLAWILALLGLLVILGLPVPQAVFLAAGTLASLLAAALAIQDGWEQAGQRRYSPGANDNASGVGALMALAEHLAAHPAQIKVGFAFTGAEEPGLFGAQALAIELAKSSGKLPLALSVDMVASGERLNLVTRAGQLFPRRCDAGLLERLRRADPLAGELAYTQRSGDFVPFLRLGFPAAGLESNGQPRFWRAYHTLQDGLAVVDPARLAHTVEVLVQLVWLLGKERNA